MACFESFDHNQESKPAGMSAPSDLDRPGIPTMAKFMELVFLYVIVTFIKKTFVLNQFCQNHGFKIKLFP